MLKAMKNRSIALIALVAALASCGESPAPTPSETSSGTEESATSNPKLVQTSWVVGDSTNQTVMRMETARNADERALNMSRRTERGNYEGMALIGASSLEPVTISNFDRPLVIASVGSDGAITTISRHEAGATTSFEPPAGTVAILLVEADILGIEAVKEGAKALMTTNVAPV